MALAASCQRQQWRWTFTSGVFGTLLGALLGAEYAADDIPLAPALEHAFAAASGGGLLSAVVGAFTYHALYKS